MDKTLLLPEVQDFIDRNTGADVSRLALLKNPFPQFNYTEILNQVAAKTKAKSKLPTWYTTQGIVYPSKVSVEQTSSEKTAEYKSGLVSGQSLIDLTGGFGVDDFYFSKRIREVVHCEIDPGLSEIAAHNFGKLNAVNIRCETGDSSEILERLGRRFDWIYIDPSRRSQAKGKVFMLADCLPNVPELLDFYFSRAHSILVKTAPLLDITAAVSELRNVREIHVVAVENEVKELLFALSAGFTASPEIISANLLDGNSQFFKWDPAKSYDVLYGAPEEYLYEPNAAIMKSGAFNAIGPAYGLKKLHRHSHLYTSRELVPDFPGRIFSIEKALAYDKRHMKEWLQGKKGNITVRNFPETVEALRRKWKIRDGGNLFCFFTTSATNDKIVLLCAKIQI